MKTASVSLFGDIARLHSAHAELNLRPAVLADAAALSRLVGELGYPTDAEAMHERLRAILKHADYQTIVAELAERVIGMVGIMTGWQYERNGAYGRLVALSVAEGCRGRGIGTALVEAAEHWLRSRGVERVIVSSADHRIDAHAFYVRRGYSRTGVRFVKDLGGSRAEGQRFVGK